MSFFVAQVGKQRLRLNLLLPAGNVGWSFSLEEWHHFLPTVGFGAGVLVYRVALLLRTLAFPGYGNPRKY